VTFLRRSSLTAVASVILLAPALAAQEPTTPSPRDVILVTGRVVTLDGQAPLSYAQVGIAELKAGGQTREDGRYSFTVPASAANGQVVTLTARAIGFKAKSVQVVLSPGLPPQDFVLESNPLQLGEVVITGAGTTSEAQKIGNVRSHVDSSAIQASNEPNVVQTLSAKAPNVTVTSSAGDPGASSSILIRGANTLGRPSDPLIVVDGTPIDNSTTTVAFLDPQTGGPQGGVSSPNRAVDINPADIESVEILKGAAAGAIYGARAGQGVVLITTKKGRPGTTRFSLTSSVSFDNVTKFPALQRQFGQGDDGVSDPCATDPTPDCYATPDTWGPQLEAGVKTYDHTNELYQTGHFWDNVLNISGGNEKTSFFLSGGYFTQDGTVLGPHDYLHRATVRLKAEHAVADNLRIGGNVMYAQTEQDAVQKGFNYASIPWTSWLTPPEFNNNPYLDPATGVHRSYRFPDPSVGSIPDSTRGYDNPYFSAYTSQSTTLNDRVLGNMTIQWTALSWLNFSEALGVDYANDQRVQGEAQGNSQTFLPGGQVLTLNLTHTQFDNNLIATGTYTVNPNWGGSVSVGQNINSRSFQQLGEVGDVLLAPTPYSLNNTATQRPPTSYQSYVHDIGYFAQATFDLWDALFLKAGLRYDGFSTFSPSHQYYAFPSASAAWQFSKTFNLEDSWLSFGKARLAYGEVGTEPGPYVSSKVFQANGQIPDAYGGLFLTASQGGVGGLFTPVTEPAEGLGPERTKELEGGIDLGFLKDRISFSATFYNRNSSDVILPIPVAASTGYQLQVANAAEIRNRGGEFTLTVRPIVSKDLAWDVTLLGGYNNNDVLSLRGADFVPYGGNGGFLISYAQLGGSVGSFRDFDYVRCGRGVVLTDGSGNPYNVDQHCTSSQISQKALFISDGTLTNASGVGANPGFPLLDPTQYVVGSPDPKWTGSFSTSLRYKRWNFSLLLDHRSGGLVWNGTHETLNFFGTSAESAKRGTTVTFGQNFMSGAVAGPGAGDAVVLDQNWFQNYYGGISPHSIGFPFYEDGTFTKLREIAVGYVLDERWVTHNLGLSSIEVRLAGRNLYTWSNYSGADPEVNSPGAETGARGIDFFTNPQTRSVVITFTFNR